MSTHPCTNVKPPYWRLSGNGSGVNKCDLVAWFMRSITAIMQGRLTSSRCFFVLEICSSHSFSIASLSCLSTKVETARLKPAAVKSDMWSFWNERSKTTVTSCLHVIKQRSQPKSEPEWKRSLSLIAAEPWSGKNTYLLVAIGNDKQYDKIGCTWFITWPHSFLAKRIINHQV